jgi:hypothetical protein
MKQNTIIAIIISVLVIVAGFFYYYKSNKSNKPTPVPTTPMPTTPMPTTPMPTKDPRSNFTNVVKGGIKEKFDSATITENSSDITKSVMNEWPNLISLVTSITGKRPQLCFPMPDKILRTDNSLTNGSSMNIMITNVSYVTKNALNVAANNENFYDIAAIFFETVKVQSGNLPYPMTFRYDSNGLVTAVSITTPRDGPWTIKFFSDFLPKSIDIPSPSTLGNDSDLISFMNKMVPFYNSYVPTLSQSMPSPTPSSSPTPVFIDINTFGKLIACVFTLGFINPRPPILFDCFLSNQNTKI